MRGQRRRRECHATMTIFKAYYGTHAYLLKVILNMEDGGELFGAVSGIENQIKELHRK